MKRLYFIGIFLVTATLAQAAEMSGESHFHLLTARCESEIREGAESTPQSPPLNVDDPSTPGCNVWEINVVVDGDLTREQRTLETPLLDINYGIGDNIQLKYELPYVSDRSQGTGVSAVGESKAGVKYMFFEDEQTKLQFAAYPQLTFVQTSADAVKQGLATPGTIITLPVLMARKIGETTRGDVVATANLGFNISTKPDTANFLSASVGVGTPILRRVSIMGELATEQAMVMIADEARAKIVKAGVGIIGTINDQFLIFGSFGHSLSTSDSYDHTYGLVGFRLLAGGVSPSRLAATEH